VRLPESVVALPGDFARPTACADFQRNIDTIIHLLMRKVDGIGGSAGGAGAAGGASCHDVGRQPAASLLVEPHAAAHEVRVGDAGRADHPFVALTSAPW